MANKIRVVDVSGVPVHGARTGMGGHKLGRGLGHKICDHNNITRLRLVTSFSDSAIWLVRCDDCGLEYEKVLLSS